MEEVYVVIVSYLNVDEGACENSIQVYDSLNKATQRMKLEIEDAKMHFQNYNYDDDTYSDGDMEYSIWESGEYLSHHITIEIAQCGID